MAPSSLLLESLTGCTVLLACTGWLSAALLYRRIPKNDVAISGTATHKMDDGDLTWPDAPHNATATAEALPGRGKTGKEERAAFDEQKSALLADTIPGMAVILGPMGQILACNAGTQARYGESLSALLRHPAARKALHEALDAPPAKEDGLPAIIKVTISLDVPVRQTIRLAMRRIAGPTGRERRVLALLDDRSTIEASERMRADFLAHASHELRTPLASLSGFIDLLREGGGDTGEDQALYLGIMDQQATRMRRLIDRLLYLSQLQLRGHARPRTRLDVEELFAIVTGEVTPRFHQSDRVLEVTCEDGLTLLADEDEMVQVFLNLIENAIRYATQPGKSLHIHLSARRTSPEDDPTTTRDGILLAVEDNGPGIAARHLPRLTERFYRVQDSVGGNQTADMAETDAEEGVGLGLAIVRQILERHNGQLRFTSIPGKGTACLLWLPGAPAE